MEVAFFALNMCPTCATSAPTRGSDEGRLSPAKQRKAELKLLLFSCWLARPHYKRAKNGVLVPPSRSRARYRAASAYGGARRNPEREKRAPEASGRL